MTPAERCMVNDLHDYSEFLEDYDYDFVVGLPDEDQSPLPQSAHRRLMNLHRKVTSRTELELT